MDNSKQRTIRAVPFNDIGPTQTEREYDLIKQASARRRSGQKERKYNYRGEVVRRCDQPKEYQEMIEQRVQRMIERHEQGKPIFDE